MTLNTCWILFSLLSLFSIFFWRETHSKESPERYLQKRFIRSIPLVIIRERSPRETNKCLRQEHWWVFVVGVEPLILLEKLIKLWNLSRVLRADAIKIFNLYISWNMKMTLRAHPLITRNVIENYEYSNEYRRVICIRIFGFHSSVSCRSI